jgi:hypothetical protein
MAGFHGRLFTNVKDRSVVADPQKPEQSHFQGLACMVRA